MCSGMDNITRNLQIIQKNLCHIGNPDTHSLVLYHGAVGTFDLTPLNRIRSRLGSIIFHATADIIMNQILLDRRRILHKTLIIYDLR